MKFLLVVLLAFVFYTAPAGASQDEAAPNPELQECDTLIASIETVLDLLGNTITSRLETLATRISGFHKPLFTEPLEEGPDEQKTFTVSASIISPSGERFDSDPAIGKTKKNAKAQASRQLYRKLLLRFAEIRAFHAKEFAQAAEHKTITSLTPELLVEKALVVSRRDRAPWRDYTSWLTRFSSKFSIGRFQVVRPGEGIAAGLMLSDGTVIARKFPKRKLVDYVEQHLAYEVYLDVLQSDEGKRYAQGAPKPQLKEGKRPGGPPISELLASVSDPDMAEPVPTLPVKGDYIDYVSVIYLFRAKYHWRFEEVVIQELTPESDEPATEFSFIARLVFKKEKREPFEGEKVTRMTKQAGRQAAAYSLFKVLWATDDNARKFFQSLGLQETAPAPTPKPRLDVPVPMIKGNIDYVSLINLLVLKHRDLFFPLKFTDLTDAETPNQHFKYAASLQHRNGEGKFTVGEPETRLGKKATEQAAAYQLFLTLSAEVSEARAFFEALGLDVNGEEEPVETPVEALLEAYGPDDSESEMEAAAAPVLKRSAKRKFWDYEAWVRAYVQSQPEMKPPEFSTVGGRHVVQLSLPDGKLLKFSVTGSGAPERLMRHLYEALYNRIAQTESGLAFLVSHGEPAEIPVVVSSSTEESKKKAKAKAGKPRVPTINAAQIFEFAYETAPRKVRVRKVSYYDQKHIAIVRVYQSVRNPAPLDEWQRQLQEKFSIPVFVVPEPSLGELISERLGESAPEFGVIRDPASLEPLLGEWHPRSYYPYTAAGGSRVPREDLRNLDVFYIDPPKCKDHDDAISDEPLPNYSVPEGHTLLGVHIADVRELVMPGSPVDLNARAQGSTIYGQRRERTMFPEWIAHDQSSLVKGRDRFAWSVFIHLDDHGVPRNAFIHRSLIQVKKAYVYDQVDGFLKSESPESARFKKLHHLARLLRKRRAERGGLTLKKRKGSDIIVEEFMLMANQVIARYLVENQIPFFHRFHENFDKALFDSYLAAQAQLDDLGSVRDEMASSEDSLKSAVTSVLHSLDPADASSLLSQLLTRAHYTVSRKGHFALSFDDYTHFTSPIRRYPDFIVQTQLAALFGDGVPYTAEELQAMEPDLNQVIFKSEREGRLLRLLEIIHSALKTPFREYKGEIDTVLSDRVLVRWSKDRPRGILTLEDGWIIKDKSLFHIPTERSWKKGDPIKVSVGGFDLDQNRFILDIEDSDQSR